jgi:uncharacterized protein (TIGR03067 family)
MLVMSALSLVSVAFAGGGPDAKQVQDELKKLEGTWEIVSYEKNGTKFPADFVEKLPKLTFKGNDYSWSNGMTGKIADINPAKKPKTITYRHKSADGKDQIENGIYELEGDTFKECLSPIGAEARPTDFSTKEGNAQVLIVYKRAK